MYKQWLNTRHIAIDTNFINCLVGIELIPCYDEDMNFVGQALRIGFGLFEVTISW